MSEPTPVDIPGPHAELFAELHRIGGERVRSMAWSETPHEVKGLLYRATKALRDAAAALRSQIAETAAAGGRAHRNNLDRLRVESELERPAT